MGQGSERSGHFTARRVVTSRTVGVLRSSRMARRWGSHDVRLHGARTKHFHHNTVGSVELAYESVDMISDAGLTMTIYVVEPASSNPRHQPRTRSRSSQPGAAPQHRGNTPRHLTVPSSSDPPSLESTIPITAKRRPTSSRLRNHPAPRLTGNTRLRRDPAKPVGRVRGHRPPGDAMWIPYRLARGRRRALTTLWIRSRR
jgi:MmyB-like transcription regulator ligand binding domain